MPKIQIADKPTLDAVYAATNKTAGLLKAAEGCPAKMEVGGKSTTVVVDVVGKGKLLCAAHVNSISTGNVHELKITVDDNVIFHIKITHSGTSTYGASTDAGVFSLNMAPVLGNTNGIDRIVPFSYDLYVPDPCAQQELSPELKEVTVNGGSSYAFMHWMYDYIRFERNLKVELTLDAKKHETGNNILYAYAIYLLDE